MADDSFPIVGIGASAGGLQALEGLLRTLPADTGMAFVVVTHLAAGKESNLPQILGRFTAMPVAPATNGTSILPNQVYVSPPGCFLTLQDNKFWLAPQTPELHWFPIDVFLISLAENSGEAAIGIVLSGGGSDGTAGVRAIKEHGGLTFAQHHNSSGGPAQSGMPESAIAAGVVDLVLTVEDMGPRLAELARSFVGPRAPAAAAIAAADKGITPSVMQDVAEILLKQVGHDFSGYKPRTFVRRVQRRMKVLRLVEVDDYVERLRHDTDEVSLLFRDLLIGVTSFFRDPAAFEALAEQVLPRLFDGKGVNDTVRVWVPGCATGEEAYSIAILLRERMDGLRSVPKVQIFATDIDDVAVQFARIGRYRPAALANVSSERLQRFFVHEDGRYAISKDIRELCMFSPHNVLSDPPFSNLDLISCRNLLIYFSALLQTRVLPIFHFALRPGGFLFLGSSENVSEHPDLFAPLDRKYRIFQRRDQVATPRPIPAFIRHNLPVLPQLAGRPGSGGMLAKLRDMVQARVMEHFAPAHVVANREGNVLYYSARNGKYLEAPPGLPNQQLDAMVRKGLRHVIRSALREASETRRPVERPNLTFEFDGQVQGVTLFVEPFGDNADDPLFLVLFQDVGGPVTSGTGGGPATDKPDQAAELLDKELRETRDRLQTAVDEYEATLADLKSSNEELQSVNEELQSNNEEMETSREEMQSVNEELHAVNTELNDKVEQLDRANADLRNVYDSTRVAIVFLDRQLMIRTFTPAATALFRLVPADHGRPLSDIANNLEGAGDLRRDIENVFKNGSPIERRVRQSDMRSHYFMRILPYREQAGGAIEGVLIVFVDVTPLVEADQQQRMLLEELNARVRNILDVMTSFTGRALTRGISGKMFSEALLARIRSMAMCYRLLERGRWVEIELRDILSGELDEYRTKDEGRILLDGPRIVFKAPDGLALAMAIHELATNAAVHGALSRPKGRIAVTWHLTTGKGGDVLHLEWRESRGPSVKKPRQTGFGVAIIDRELKTTLRATVTMDFARSGLVTKMLIPLDAVNVKGELAQRTHI